MPESSSRTVLALCLVVALVGSAAVVGVGFGQQTEAGNDTESELTTQSTSHLRVAHAAPGAGPVDVYVDNQSVASNVPFGAVGDYLALEAGTHTVTVTAVGVRDAVVFNETVDLEARSVTTVAATLNGSDTENASVVPEAYTDDARTPADNESALRIVHLSPNAPAVDIVAVSDGDDATEVGNDTETATDGEATETVLAENLTYTNTTDYMTVPAGNYTVEVRTADGNETVVATVDVSLDAGTAYSAWAIGNVLDNGASPPTFRVLTTEDVSKTLEFPANETETPDENATEETDTENATDETDTDTEETETSGENATDETETDAEATDTETEAAS